MARSEKFWYWHKVMIEVLLKCATSLVVQRVVVMRKPYVLIILDGFGHSDTSDSNAITAAKMPNWQHT